MKFLNILFLLLLSFGAYAQTELLNEPLRPSIGVVREKYDTIQVAANQLATGSRINFAYFRDSIEDGAPQFITKLEKAYPNGTYMFIGRDTQLIADVVDAFYISIGHKDRVKQVGVSTPTLAG